MEHTKFKLIRSWLNSLRQRLNDKVWFVTIAYFLMFTILYYGVSVKIESLGFFLGAVSALPLVYGVELILNLPYSLYHTVLFQFCLFILAVFVLTSTTASFGKGLILSLLFSQLVLQVRDVFILKDSASWFGKDGGLMSLVQQRLYVLVAVVFYVFITIYLV